MQHEPKCVDVAQQTPRQHAACSPQIHFCKNDSKKKKRKKILGLGHCQHYSVEPNVNVCVSVCLCGKSSRLAKCCRLVSFHFCQFAYRRVIVSHLNARRSNFLSAFSPSPPPASPPATLFQMHSKYYIRPDFSVIILFFMVSLWTIPFCSFAFILYWKI